MPIPTPCSSLLTHTACHVLSFVFSLPTFICSDNYFIIHHFPCSCIPLSSPNTSLLLPLSILLSSLLQSFPYRSLPLSPPLLSLLCFLLSSFPHLPLLSVSCDSFICPTLSSTSIPLPFIYPVLLFLFLSLPLATLSSPYPVHLSVTALAFPFHIYCQLPLHYFHIPISSYLLPYSYRSIRKLFPSLPFSFPFFILLFLPPFHPVSRFLPTHEEEKTKERDLINYK